MPARSSMARGARVEAGGLTPAPDGAGTDAEQLTPAKPDDIAEAIAVALRYSGRKRVNDARANRPAPRGDQSRAVAFASSIIV
jgi:hypothetical protein